MAVEGGCVEALVAVLLAKHDTGVQAQHAVLEALAALTHGCEAACARVLALGTAVDDYLVALIRGNSPTRLAVLAAKL